MGLDAEGQLLPPGIGENEITKMRECLAKTREKIVVEVKAQRLADSHGVYGWRAVKGINIINFFLIMKSENENFVEYETHELAEDENDAALIREAVARAKKMARVSKVGHLKDKEFLEVAPPKVEAQIGPGFVQPAVQAWGPVFPQPQLNQNVQFQPIFKERITAFDKIKRSGQLGKTYPCVRYFLSFLG